MKKGILWLAAALLFAAGFLFLVYPQARSWLYQRQSRQEIARFQQEFQETPALSLPEEETPAEEPEPEDPGEETGGSGESETAGEDLRDYGNLRQEMEAYNERIYRERQTSLQDAWSFQVNALDFKGAGIQDNMAGYISIAAMDLELPLYVGATEENMRKGAVILGQTSMPVGGENTNCVIAAHRGYRGEPFFREIERLQPGDLVQVTNFWETLTYQVVKAIVVNPDEIQAVKILEGQDMVTLVSCHPYTENYLRYIVYCTRTDNPAENATQEDPETGVEAAPSGAESQSPEGEETASGSSGEAGGNTLTAEEIPFQGVPYTSSRSAIREEQMLNRAGLWLFVGLAVLLLLILAVQRGGKKKRKHRK